MPKIMRIVGKMNMLLSKVTSDLNEKITIICFYIQGTVKCHLQFGIEKE